MSWKLKLVPSILLPTFTWPHRLPSTDVTETSPPVPAPAPRWLRLLIGYAHKALKHFSLRYYCRWTGIPINNQLMHLPFGLVLKWSDGTRIEEVLATKMARAARIPVPVIISYGEHPNTPHAPVSILMTRLPGDDLGQVYEKLSDSEKQAVFADVKTIFDAVRKWKSPWGDTRICSPSGAGIRSIRVPEHFAPPCENKDEFIDYLLLPASDHRFPSREAFLEGLATVNSIRSIPHRIVFSHGDLKHHNIMVHAGRVSGIIDFESAGWYPEYWDFTTARWFLPRDYWWYDFVARLGGSEYEREQEIERVLFKLTIHNFIW
ncbi:kinase-like domain-containing protein [Phyllosticta citrichinensis]|uniref:Kinase-like domain-containing protein n=1 Tax=Phyllosticta citrichinensis TaxID=1130410 RepID=A0ABR1Y4T2_9PEZI